MCSEASAFLGSLQNPPADSRQVSEVTRDAPRHLSEAPSLGPLASRLHLLAHRCHHGEKAQVADRGSAPDFNGYDRILQDVLAPTNASTVEHAQV